MQHIRSVVTKKYHDEFTTGPNTWRYIRAPKTLTRPCIDRCSQTTRAYSSTLHVNHEVYTAMNRLTHSMTRNYAVRNTKIAFYAYFQKPTSRRCDNPIGSSDLVKLAECLWRCTGVLGVGVNYREMNVTVATATRFSSAAINRGKLCSCNRHSSRIILHIVPAKTSSTCWPLSSPSPV